MRTLRPAAVLLGSATTLLLLAGPAFAHVSIDKSSVPADSNQTLQVRVPGENPPAYSVKLTLEVPAGFTAKSCADKLGWTCAIKPDTSNGRSALITWTRQSGADAVNVFDFVVRTPNKNGAYAFEATQFYSDGKKAFWDGPAGSDHAAPVLEVTGASSTPVTNSAAPQSHSGSQTKAPVASSSTPTPLPDLKAAGSNEGGGLPLGLLAGSFGVLSAAAGAFAWRRRRTGHEARPTKGIRA